MFFAQQPMSVQSTMELTGLTLEEVDSTDKVKALEDQ